MNQTTNPQTIPTVITLVSEGGHVFAKVAGKVIAMTADTQGLIKRLDRQMRAEGIIRESGYDVVEGHMVADGWILR